VTKQRTMQKRENYFVPYFRCFASFLINFNT